MKEFLKELELQLMDTKMDRIIKVLDQKACKFDLSDAEIELIEKSYYIKDVMRKQSIQIFELERIQDEIIERAYELYKLIKDLEEFQKDNEL